ncbi:unnamed protein product [Lymnaea stagnalis]|uniref:Fucolectin tachylectin-4 pentraxin-1 domain-containing protein n=1 Tax=Lymnaea stagnalis TaxID=6523 RepID=A0AAV2HVK6_LYMST
MRFTFSLILIIISASLVVIEACDSGWYGPRCQFMCHCSNNQCDEAGRCLNGDRCRTGWFGPGCQYQDVSVLANVTTSLHHGDVLTDGEDLTCIRKLTYVTSYLSSPYPVIWVRAVGPYFGPGLASLGEISLSYKEHFTDSLLQNGCNSIKTSVLDDNIIVDVFCETSVTAAVLHLSWERPVEICSLYISGGRNLALKQNATQSSIYYDPNGVSTIADNAVDGNTNTNYGSGSCAHTDSPIAEPHWNLMFPNTVNINRIVVYNRLDVGGNLDGKCCSIRLKGFKIAVYDSLRQKVYSFTDTSSKPQVSYTVIEPKINVNASEMQISVANPEKVLALCEVEVFGYDICPPGFYGPECSRRCNCKDVEEVCNMRSGICESGCAAGFLGESCDLDCGPGSVIAACLKPPCINEKCIDSTCDSDTGKCIIGCVNSSSTDPVCLSGCEDKRFGSTCQFACHCTDNGCDNRGYCKEDSYCALRWFGAGCQYQDLSSQAKLVTSPDHKPSHIIDGDDATCVLDLDNIEVNFTRSVSFAWIRLVVLEPDEDHTKANIHFTNSQTGEEFNCTNMLEDILDRRTTDIYCELSTVVDHMNIALNKPRSLCSVHISGGRNIALYGRTNQSSFYAGLDHSEVASSVAVDGDTLGDTCARTSINDPRPYWTLTLPRPHVVSRYVVYNGVSVTGSRQGFIIHAEDQFGQTAFQTTVLDVWDNFTVILTPNVSTPIRYVKIEPLPGTDRLLTLCEVQVYGDVVCPVGWFGPECDRRCNCAYTSDTCLISSGGCLLGCAAGFRGEGCNTPCSPGTWGVGCFNRCNEDCVDDFCDAINGTCPMEHPAPLLTWL